MKAINDHHWESVRHHFPEENPRLRRNGRKPVPSRYILDAVLWVLNSGARWHMLPKHYPNYKTVHRRLQQWCHNEGLREVLIRFAHELKSEGLICERKCKIEQMFGR
ncbi:MAG: transposase [Xanthomonadales bacterium]|jgi:transposase|nr:transposase [Xanthomonadales bacterium]